MRVEYLEPKLCLIKSTTCLVYVVVSVIPCQKQNLGGCTEIARFIKILQGGGKYQDHDDSWFLKTLHPCLYVQKLTERDCCVSRQYYPSSIFDAESF